MPYVSPLTHKGCVCTNFVLHEAAPPSGAHAAWLCLRWQCGGSTVAAIRTVAVRRQYGGGTPAVRLQYAGSTAAVRRRQYAGSHRSSSKAVVVDVIVVKMHNDHGEPQPGRCLSNYSGRPNVYESWLELNHEILEFYLE